MCVFSCPWNSSVPTHSSADSGRGGIYGTQASILHTPRSVWAPVSQAGGFSRSCHMCELQSRCRCSHHIFHCVDTVLASQVPRFPRAFSLLCILSSQRSLQSIAKNYYKLCIVLSFTVIICICFFFVEQTHTFPGSKHVIEYYPSSFTPFLDFRSRIQSWANSELTVIGTQAKSIYGGSDFLAWVFLIFVAAKPFKSLFAVHVILVS